MSGTLHVICSRSVSVAKCIWGLCLCVCLVVCGFATLWEWKTQKIDVNNVKEQPNLSYAIFEWAFDVEQLNIVSLLSVIGFFFILTWFTPILLSASHSLRLVFFFLLFLSTQKSNNFRLNSLRLILFVCLNPSYSLSISPSVQRTLHYFQYEDNVK